jgi:hypothetical protein
VAEIVVIDSDDEHVYQPGLLFVPFGQARPVSLVAQDTYGVLVVLQAIDAGGKDGRP